MTRPKLPRSPKRKLRTFGVSIRKTCSHDSSGNGEDFDRASFKEFIADFRATVIDRQLINQSFVVVPEDAEGKAGSVAHILEMSGIQQGKNITIKIVAVLNIIFDQKTNSRLIKMESFVLGIDEN